MTVEVDESQDLQGELASWRPRKGSGVIPLTSEGLRTGEPMV